jgi:hypothetical protein
MALTAGVIAAVLLGLGLAAALAWPLTRRDAGASERRQTELSRARELQSRHDMLVASLKDLEEDRATDKVDQADYDALHAQLTAEAVKLMRELDGLAAERARADDLEHPVVLHPRARRPDAPA